MKLGGNRKKRWIMNTKKILIMALALTVLTVGAVFNAVRSTASAEEVTSMSAQSAKINQDGIRARSSTDTTPVQNTQKSTSRTVAQATSTWLIFISAAS